MIVVRPSTASVWSFAIRKSASNSKVPVAAHSMTMPATKPRSPSFVVQNAFTAAAAAEGRVYQYPISRYEHRPTSSQKMNIWRYPGASTSPSIENAKSDW